MLMTQGWERVLSGPFWTETCTDHQVHAADCLSVSDQPSSCPSGRLEVAQRAIKRLMKLQSRACGDHNWLCTCLLPAGGFS